MYLRKFKVYIYKIIFLIKKLVILIIIVKNQKQFRYLLIKELNKYNYEMKYYEIIKIYY